MALPYGHVRVIIMATILYEHEQTIIMTSIETLWILLIHH